MSGAGHGKRDTRQSSAPFATSSHFLTVIHATLPCTRVLPIRFSSDLKTWVKTVTGGHAGAEVQDSLNKIWKGYALAVRPRPRDMDVLRVSTFPCIRFRLDRGVAGPDPPVPDEVGPADLLGVGDQEIDDVIRESGLPRDRRPQADVDRPPFGVIFVAGPHPIPRASGHAESSV